MAGDLTSDFGWYEIAVDRWDKSRMREHWLGRRVGRWLLAEDEQGDLCVPSLTQRDYWHGWFDARKPWHWPSWLLSRSLRMIVMVEKP